MAELAVWLCTSCSVPAVVCRKARGELLHVPRTLLLTDECLHHESLLCCVKFCPVESRD